MVEIKAESARPRTSTRDHTVLHQQLTTWLKARVDHPSLSDLRAPTGTGMSSETVLFDLDYQENGTAKSLRCVARLPPEATSVPVFPVYDLKKQFEAMQFARKRSQVPVPRTLWLELDSSHLGSPFFVMERIDGEAPPDIPPYVFGSWLLSATPADQQRLQQSAIAVLAELHGIDFGSNEIDFLRQGNRAESALRRHVAAQHEYYEWVVADGIRQPLIERGFAWLEANWPRDEGPETLSWGDARIGNMLFRDFQPTAVEVWEMASTAPREVDLGWMIYLHHFFQDFTPLLNMSGMPDFMRLDEVSRSYATLSGYQPRQLEFYTLYAALRHAIVMARIGRRQAHFGESAIPANPDEMIPHSPAIEAMMEGSYWQSRR